MKVKLPNGFMDGPDHFNLVEIDELRGKQQNYLADAELIVGNIGHIPKILKDMILSISTEEGVEWKGSKDALIDKLPTGDIEVILVKIREKTYGPKYYFESECPHCQHVQTEQMLKLDELEITYFPVEELVKKHKIKLPKEKKEVELKPLYLRDLFESLKIAKEKQNSSITSFLSLAIKRVGKKDNITSEDLENLAATDINFLVEESKNVTLQGEIDNKIEIECENCKKEYIKSLPCYDPNFFDPSKGSMN